jgi:hypothetical protein
MLSSYQVVLWKQESFGVLRPLQIEFFRSLREETTADQCFEQIKAVRQSRSTDSSCIRKAIQQMLATPAQQRDLEAH